MTETIFHAFLVGNSFRNIDEQECLAGHDVGDLVMLERDPDNPYDSNAIKVLDFNEEYHLGFVAATNSPNVAAEIAPLMDADDTLRAVLVDGGTPKKPLLEITAVQRETSR